MGYVPPTLRPGMIMNLRPGETLTTIAPIEYRCPVKPTRRLADWQLAAQMESEFVIFGKPRKKPDGILNWIFGLATGWRFSKDSGAWRIVRVYPIPPTTKKPKGIE